MEEVPVAEEQVVPKTHKDYLTTQLDNDLQIVEEGFRGACVISHLKVKHEVMEKYALNLLKLELLEDVKNVYLYDLECLKKEQQSLGTSYELLSQKIHVAYEKYLQHIIEINTMTNKID